MFKAGNVQDSWDLEAQARAQRRQLRRFMRLLRASQPGAFDPRAGGRGGFHLPGWRSHGMETGWAERAPRIGRAFGVGHVLRACASLAATGRQLVTAAAVRLRGLPWWSLARGGGLATASGLAMAGVLATQGYLAHDPDWVRARLADRQGNGLFDRDGALIGALYPAGTRIDTQAFGYVAQREPLPALYRALLLHLEHQHHDSWRNVAGTDLFSLAQRAVTGSGGGSTLAAQLAKQLAEPEERRSDNLAMALVQKAQGLGITAAVHQALGGPQGVLDAFVSYAPVVQINGTTRGADAGSRVQFGLPLAKASAAQQALLASEVQRPLALADAAAFAPGCAALRAMAHAAAVEAGRDTVVARGQCQTLARARVALKAVLPAGPELDQALEQIATWEREGIRPVDRFAPLPTRRQVNLSALTQSVLGPDLLHHVAREADALDLPRGSPIMLSFSGDEQSAFRGEVQAALAAIDAAPTSRELLCVTLSAASGPRHCARVPAGYARADVLLGRVRVVDGGFTRLFHTSSAAWDQPRQAGSIAKLPIAVAAMAAGYTADSRVCPRAARTGGRPLRRDSRVAPYGYRNCEGHEMPLYEAFATSDGLAFFDLARQLGPQRLLAAATALNLATDDEVHAHPAFTLAFGTLRVKPAQMLEAGQALFALAHDLRVRAGAPNLLTVANVAGEAGRPLAYDQLAALLPGTGQREELLRLLQAPVQHRRGTLHSLAGDGIDSGKTGTTSSAFSPAPGQNPYVQSKLALTYQPRDRTVALAVVAGPEPQPLGQSHLPGDLFNPLRRALVR